MTHVMPLTLLSPDFAEGYTLPQWARSGIAGAGGEDRSPTLHWQNAPSGTRSFALTVFDPDAPGDGFWHWAVFNLPAKLTALPQDAGNPESASLPPTAETLTNDAQLPRYLGAAPPAGSGEHHYIFTLSALDVERLDIAADTPASRLEELIAGHVVARARLTGVTETP